MLEHKTNMPWKPTLLLEDWAELFGMENVAADLQAGKAFPHEVRAQLAQKREVYPDSPFDYVRALDGLGELVTRVESAIAEQNYELDKLNGALRDAGLMAFFYDPRRMLTEEERFQVESLEDELEAEAREAEEEAEEAEDLVRELEQEQADLEDEAIEAEDEQERLEERRDAIRRGEDPGPDPGPSAGDDGGGGVDDDD